MRKIVSALLLVATLSGCAGGGALSLLTGGGPKVAASVQAGHTNTQTVGKTENTTQRVENSRVDRVEQSTGATSVRAERVEKVTVNAMDPVAFWVMLVFAGFLIPSPAEIARWVKKQFSRTAAPA